MDVSLFVASPDGFADFTYGIIGNWWRASVVCWWFFLFCSLYLKAEKFNKNHFTERWRTNTHMTPSLWVVRFFFCEWWCREKKSNKRSENFSLNPISICFRNFSCHLFSNEKFFFMYKFYIIPLNQSVMVYCFVIFSKT